MRFKIIKHYYRADVQKAILELAKDREIAVRFGDKGYGKRPDILQFEGDIKELAKQGATSFHVSEEQWYNPLDLRPGMKKTELDNNRKGWTLLLDIDTKFLEYSKITAELLIEAFKFHNLENYSLKFSGGNGIHLGIPFESFPKKIHNQETRLLFPEGVKIVASYLQNLIHSHLSARILEMNTIQEIAKSLGKHITDICKKGVFNPFSIVDIDPIAISSRHMFRSVFSINEKSNMVSIPIKPSKIKSFQLKQAKLENVEVNLQFLKYNDIGRSDAAELMIQAFDWNLKNIKQKTEIRSGDKLENSIPEIAIKTDLFPPCINKIFDGIKHDGRKRAIFVLLNFLRQMGWSYENIETEIMEWNKKNYEPLRANYILAQISWHKKNNQNILPPNCSNEVYYNKNECHNDHWCNGIKNPVQYVKRKLKVMTKSRSNRKAMFKNEKSKVRQ